MSNEFVDYNDTMYRLISMLLERHMSGIDIMRELELSRNQFYRLKDKMRVLGIPIAYEPSTGTYSLNNNTYLSDTEFTVLSRVARLGLDREQIDAVLRALSQKARPVEPVEISFSENFVRFGVISDMHIGSKFYRHDVLEHAISNFARQDVQFVINAGDTIEGMSNREGHIYELDPIKGLGVTNQVKYLADEFERFSELGLDVYSIEAQGSHGGWAQVRANQGLEIGDYITSKVPSYKFLGYDEADLFVDGIDIRLRHPERKYLEDYIISLPGGHKPHMVFDGHYHNRVGYKFIRNVHGFDCGTMQDQTPFLQRMSSPALVGYWIVEIAIGESPNGSTQVRLGTGKYIESVTNQFIAFYD
jgi:hypothetical protein